jgi:transcription elongation GreA/GreB family factor
MSRAFVKEADEAPPELPDRQISPHPNYVTAHGLELSEAEAEKYTAALAEAQAGEDRDAIAAASRELRYWTQRRATAEVQPRPEDADAVHFGSRVTIERDDGRKQTFQIVGEDEADPAKGTVSYVSPVAHALMGKGVGDVVTVGKGGAEIIKIERSG